jgi:hypothetical protein
MPVYEGALEKLRSLKPEAATYLEAASPENWVEVLFRGWRYGHDTSNIVESQNGVLKLDRELPIVPLLDAIWHRVMEKRADRLCAATALLEAGREMTPFVKGVVS